MFFVYLIVGGALGYLGVYAEEVYFQFICISGMAYCMFTVGRLIQSDVDTSNFKRLLEKIHQEYNDHHQQVLKHYEQSTEKHSTKSNSALH